MFAGSKKEVFQSPYHALQTIVYNTSCMERKRFQYGGQMKSNQYGPVSLKINDL